MCRAGPWRACAACRRAAEPRRNRTWLGVRVGVRVRVGAGVRAGVRVRVRVRVRVWVRVEAVGPGTAGHANTAAAAEEVAGHA